MADHMSCVQKIKHEYYVKIINGIENLYSMWIFLLIWEKKDKKGRDEVFIESVRIVYLKKNILIFI